MSHSSDVYHEIQGNMCATFTEWCDIVIWTPNETDIERLRYDAEWGEHTLQLIGNIVEDKLIRDEDADNTSMPMMYPSTDEKINDLKDIPHPRDSLEELISGFTLKAFQIHITRWVHSWQARSRPGMGWHLAVAMCWRHAIQNFCEECLRKLFRYR